MKPPFLTLQTGSDGSRWALLTLPREAWRPIPAPGCCCQYCSDTVRKPGSESYWDTLSINVEALLRDGMTHPVYCHAPELHGAKAKRERP